MSRAMDRAMAWPDPRPIGLLQTCDEEKRAPGNPCGRYPEYLADPDAFHRQAVERAVRLGCQGILLKDQEGAWYPTLVAHPYSGLAPDVTRADINRRCQMAVDAGLWVGFTFRDTAFVDGSQCFTTLPADTLAREFNLSRAEYPGVRGIYYDSNNEDDAWREGNERRPRPASLIARLRELVGDDVLIIPEWEGPGYDQVPGVYPIRYKLSKTPLSHRHTIIPPDTKPTTKQLTEFKRSRAAGALTLVTVTWDAPDAGWVK